MSALGIRKEPGDLRSKLETVYYADHKSLVLIPWHSLTDELFRDEAPTWVPTFGFVGGPSRRGAIDPFGRYGLSGPQAKRSRLRSL